VTRTSLRETLRETREIGGLALEEEVLMELEKMNRICTSALRNTVRAERLLKRAAA
jgi:hypothetical protein